MTKGVKIEKHEALQYKTDAQARDREILGNIPSLARRACICATALAKNSFPETMLGIASVNESLLPACVVFRISDQPHSDWVSTVQTSCPQRPFQWL